MTGALIQKRLLIIISVLLGICTVLLVHFVRLYVVRDNQIIKNALETARRETHQAADSIDSRLRLIMPVVDSLANGLTDGTISDGQLKGAIEKEMADHGDFVGIGAAYAKWAYPPADSGYAPYYVRIKGAPAEWRQIEKKYAYTEPDTTWYNDPILDGSMWNEPYFGGVSQAFLAEYAVPFYRTVERQNPREPAGIVYAGYSLDFLHNLIENVGIKNAAYHFVISNKGLYIDHPDDKLVLDSTIFEHAWAKNDESLHSMAIKATQAGSGYVRSKEEGLSTLLVYEPIESTRWVLGAVFFEDEILHNNPDKVRRKLIDIVLGALFCAWLTCLFILVKYYFESRWVQWGAVGATSIFLIVGIGLIWILASIYPRQNDESHEKIIDRSSLEVFKTVYEKNSKVAREPEPIFIPTGVYIQSIDFSSGHSVELTGYIWQKYDKKIPQDSLQRGYVLPEATDPDWLEITDSVYYRSILDTGGYDLIGTYFTASLRQEFDYSMYPLDHQEIWLRLWHKDFDKNVVLVPDLESYEHANPITKPGVEQGIVLPGWEIKSSYFDHRYHSYNTNFGIEQYVGMAEFPELYFSVELKRNVLDSFISRMIPLIVVASMLFSMLIIGSKQGEEASWFGFTAMDVVIGCTALFFVLIFEHISLRESLGSSQLVYFETFYFTMYFALMLVAMNAIAFASRQKIWLIDYRDNLITKLLFWPACTGVIFVVTLIVFY